MRPLGGTRGAGCAHTGGTRGLRPAATGNRGVDSAKRPTEEAAAGQPRHARPRCCAEGTAAAPCVPDEAPEAQGVRTLEHARAARGRHGEQGGGLRLAPGGGHSGPAKPHQSAFAHSESKQLFASQRWPKRRIACSLEEHEVIVCISGNRGLPRAHSQRPLQANYATPGRIIAQELSQSPGRRGRMGTGVAKLSY
jgi:hypothetical protein